MGMAWRPPSKNADHAVNCGDLTVLVECKSMRPSLQLATYGSDESVGDMASRIASAIKQLSEHAKSIQAGAWQSVGLDPTRCLAVLATFGQNYMANSCFTRRRVLELLKSTGSIPIPWVVLSLTELDALVSLVERGHKLESIAQSICSDDESEQSLYACFKHELREDAISNFAKAKGRTFLEKVAPQTEREAAIN